MEDKFTKMIQMRQSNAKGGVISAQFYLAGEVLMEIVRERRVDTTFLGNIENLIESDCFMDALMQRIVSNKPLIMLVKTFVEGHKERIGGGRGLERKVEWGLKLHERVSRPAAGLPNVELEEMISPTWISTMPNWINQPRACLRYRNKRLCEGSNSSRSTSCRIWLNSDMCDAKIQKIYKTTLKQVLMSP